MNYPFQITFHDPVTLLLLLAENDETTPRVRFLNNRMKRLERENATYAKEVNILREWLEHTSINQHLELEKLNSLDKRIHAIENHIPPNFENSADLCLVKDLIIPAKFKVPHFMKFDGTSPPLEHIAHYCRKMTQYIHDEKLMIHCFQESLIGPALQWYGRLKSSHIQTWNDLVSAFIKRYDFNTNITRMNLQLIKMKLNQSFIEHAQHWRNMAEALESSMTDKEMVDLFILSLRPPFLQSLIGNPASNFNDIVKVGLQFESFIKSGRFEVNQNHEKQQIKEVLTIQCPQQRMKRSRTEDNIPLPANLAPVYEQLLAEGKLTPIPTPSLETPDAKRPRLEGTCAYHSGHASHSLDNCQVLKRRIRGMIRRGNLIL